MGSPKFSYTCSSLSFWTHMHHTVARYSVVRGAYLQSMGDSDFRPPGAPKPLNRSSWNLAWLITSGTRPHMPKLRHSTLVCRWTTMIAIKKYRIMGQKGRGLSQRDLFFNSEIPSIFHERRKLQTSNSCQWGWRESQGRASVVVQRTSP